MDPSRESEPTFDLRVQVPDHIISRKVGDDTVILNLESAIYFGLDPVGGRFFELLEGGQPVPEIVRIMLDEYDVPQAQLEADLVRLAEEMKASGLLRVT